MALHDNSMAVGANIGNWVNRGRIDHNAVASRAATPSGRGRFATASKLLRNLW
jgi:hypothetical protein